MAQGGRDFSLGASKAPVKCIPREGPSTAGPSILKEAETCIQRVSAGLEAASRVAAWGEGTASHCRASDRHQPTHCPRQLLLEGVSKVRRVILLWKDSQL